MKNYSIWKENINNKELKPIAKDIDCDVLIIGGGIAGLSTAYFLKDSNKNIVLIDKGICGRGASSKNTGKLTFMQELIYHKLEKNYSHEIASLYLNSQKEAISLVLDIIKENNIECNLSELDSTIFICKEKDKKSLEEEINFYKRNHIECELVNSLPISFPITLGIKTKGSYSFNPYKFLVTIKNILKDKIQIYENTPAIELNSEKDFYITKTKNNKTIKSKSVVVATQYPFFIVPYFTPFKTLVEKSFIVSGKTKEDKFQAISDGKPTFSFNYYQKDDGYLLYSRRSHSVTTNLDTRDDKEEIVKEYQKLFSKEPEYYFQNHDLMTYDYMPLIGKIDNHNLYVLTGFNKWGNTNGPVGGKLISDLILGQENSYASLFDPKRTLSMLKIKNLTVFNTKVISRYILNKIISSKSYYDNSVIIKYIDGHKCGIYTDDKGEHIVSNICPHMKCNLVFNYVDKTWDCPCHASRFDIDGNIIYGPAVYSIKTDKKSDK